MDGDQASVLRRKLRAAAGSDPAAQDQRIRRALGACLHRAGDASGGLRLGLSQFSPEAMGLDEVTAQVPNEGLLLRLSHETGEAGILHLDAALVDALVEIQATGTLKGPARPARAPTMTDAILCESFANALLHLMSAAVAECANARWMGGFKVAGRLPGRRAVAVTLPDRPIHLAKIGLEIDGDLRTGTLLLAAPEALAPKPAGRTPAGSWETRLAQRLSEAPTVLHAVMAKKRMRLAEVHRLRVGDVLPLPGDVLNSAFLSAGDGRQALPGKLGQLNGRRAFRVGRVGPVGRAAAAQAKPVERQAAAPAAPSAMAADNLAPAPGDNLAPASADNLAPAPGDAPESAHAPPPEKDAELAVEDG